MMNNYLIKGLRPEKLLKSLACYQYLAPTAHLDWLYAPEVLNIGSKLIMPISIGA
jgi:hypothetical protein